VGARIKMSETYRLHDALENRRMRATCFSPGDVYKTRDTRVVNSSFSIVEDVSVCPAVLGSIYVIKEDKR